MMTQPEVPVNTSQSNLRLLWLPALICAILLLIEIYLLVHDWGAWMRPKAPPSTNPIAWYISGKNTVRQKSVGTLVWQAPTPNLALFRQSEIATTDDSEALLRFSDESELVVEPNSLVILEEAPAQSEHRSRAEHRLQPMRTESSRIVARLVRGSLKRKNSGKTPFFVKLSSAPEAPPVEIKDATGGSVFRVIYRLQGYEIVVESGSVVVDQKSVRAGETLRQGEAPKPPLPKLAPPTLKKPKVNVLPSQSKNWPRNESRHVGWWEWWIPSAAAEVATASPRASALAPTMISIQFSWEATPDAAAYWIQISKIPDFTEVLHEEKVTGLEYQYEMSAPTEKSTLYFRVAGISDQEVVGNYSSVESVEVNPPPKRAERPSLSSQTEPVVHAPKETFPSTKASASTRVDAPTKEPSTSAKADAPIMAPTKTSTGRRPAPTETYTPPVFIESENTLWLSYGVQFRHRTLKSPEPPQSVSGNGLVPTSLTMEYQHAREPGHYFSAGASFDYENGGAKLPPPSDAAFSTSQISAWLTYGQRFNGWKHDSTWHFGVYGSTSTRVSEEGLRFHSKKILLGGPMVALHSDPFTVHSQNGRFTWRVRLAVLAIGTFGADLNASFRLPLPVFSNAFWGLEVGTRQSGVESAEHAGLRVGFELH